eukprot:UN19713
MSPVKGIHNIPHLLNDFCQFIKPFEKFWKVLDDFDDNCWILDKGNKFRRLVLTSKIIIYVKINPKRSFDLLEQCVFLGPDDQTRSLKNSYDKGILKWNSNIFPRENLQKDT